MEIPKELLKKNIYSTKTNKVFHPNVYLDILGMIPWNSAVGCWLGLRACQRVNKEIEFLSFKL